MRQLMLRLIMQIRGQERLLDYKIHTSSQYFLCDNADAFRLSPNSANASSIEVDIDYLVQTTTKFFSMQFGPGIEAMQRSVQRCPKSRPPPIEFAQIFAPYIENQTAVIPRYLKSLHLSSTKPIFLFLVGFWEIGPDIPPDYLAMLLALKSKSTKILFIGTPTAYEVRPKERGVFQGRNNAMQAWIHAQQDPHYQFVDFDALAAAPLPKPPGPVGGDKHFMCRLYFSSWRTPPVHIARGVGVQIPNGYLDKVWVTDDGRCSDEMNRNLLQVIANAIV